MKRIMKFVLAVLGFYMIAAGQVSKSYPNELPAYRFFEHATWRSLRPDIATIADVRAVLGNPDDMVDMSQYLKPYPGDTLAKQPLFTYKKLMPGWQVLVYFSGYCFRSHDAKHEANRVCSFDLIPDSKIPFSDVQFSASFIKTYDPGVETSFYRWDDDWGLEYETYVKTLPDGEKVPGNLDRISYGSPTRKY